MEVVDQPAAGESKPTEPRRLKLVYFQEDKPSVQPSPSLDTDYEEQNNFKIEELFRTPSHGCCPNQTTSPQGNLASCPLNKTVTFHELSLDLLQLQTRVLELEKKMDHELELPAIVSDLKSQIENLRNKLESVESLTRRATHGDIGYRRASEEHIREVRLRFSQIWDQEVPEHVSQSLLQPSFDTSGYDDAEMLLFLQHMFQQLGLLEAFDIPLSILRTFLIEVYKNYNQVPFHNFRHCFCVAQMMYVMACQVDLVSNMGRMDTLILLVSCICHDLDHPGYNNIYQINARTELALRYNDISPLENHHCSVAFRILENPRSNIFISMDKETFKEVREGIIRCILATDMARHNEILAQFREVTSDFDFSNRTHRNLLSMILIKVADISNEARPMDVAEPWLDRLLAEFFQQSDLEKLEGLPVTPFMDREKITKPSSQCSFIGFVLLPLFEALGELLPALQVLIIDPARYALDYYRKLNEAAKDERLRRKSVVENGENLDEGDEDSSMVKSSSGLSVSRRSVGNASIQSRQRSKSSEDGSLDLSPPMSPGAVSISFENDDMDEEETATEVEVAEKTVKFKISTETAIPPGRNTCPNSRKGSRERCQLERDCQVLNSVSDHDDHRRKSLAVIERHKDNEATAKRRRSASRLMETIEVETACWAPPAPAPPPPPPPPPPVVEEKPPIEPDKPSLLAKLRSLKDKLPWLDNNNKEDDETSQRCRTLPKRKGGSRRKSMSRGWRSWLAKGEGQSSSLDVLPHT